MKHEVTVQLHGGKSIHFETGKLAKQAHGSCIVRIGDNVVLATACANADPREGIDFFPLTVDYREYTYAAGRIPGGFIKREGRPSEREILTSRQIDRPIRPLFPEGFRCETQVIAMVLSADTTNDPDVAGINATDAPLMPATSGSLVVSADSTIAMTCVSQRKPSGNSGRIGRSICRLVRISRSLGRPSRLINPPGMRPAA